MPNIELQHIVSCSSADKNNPAENLLKCDGTHKWKSLAPGEKNVSCIIQLGKSSQIHSIDIGNEGSAFVEVLVGKATATDDKDFEVLLVASSFMSPLESRNGTNRTAVRMFGPEDLNKQTSCQSWDRVKLVCTQPFSKTFQYGLSFIKLHSPPSRESEEPKVKKLGAFTIKESEDDDDHDEIHVGSLFANRLKKDSPALPTGAAAIRMASKHPEDLIKTSLADIGKKRQAESPPLAVPQAKTPKQEKKTANDESGPEDKVQPLPLKKQSTSLSSLASSTSSSSSEKSAMKRTNTEPNKASSAKTFRKIMDRVVFVLSGFQNPGRGNLRDMALEMGAKYRPDWGKGCTHLICAFPNTPKYQQVSGKGKIVTKAWIEDCHKQKKLLPWRNYRLGKAHSPPESSDEEDELPKTFHKQTTTPKPESLKKNILKKSPSPMDSDSETDMAESKKNKPDAGGNNSLTADTRKNSDLKSSTGIDKENDPYARSTDEETDKDEDINNAASSDDNDSGLPDLPEFFTDKTFFLYGELEPSEKRLLTRYIAAYNGEVADYMSKSVHFVVTTKKWDANFDTALSENPGIIFIKPKWIHLCHEKNALMPYQHHVIVP